jgi:hypothetical protein
MATKKGNCPFSAENSKWLNKHVQNLLLVLWLTMRLLQSIVAQTTHLCMTAPGGAARQSAWMRTAKWRRTAKSWLRFRLILTRAVARGIYAVVSLASLSSTAYFQKK